MNDKAISTIRSLRRLAMTAIGQTKRTSSFLVMTKNNSLVIPAGLKGNAGISPKELSKKSIIPLLKGGKGD